MSMDIMTLVFKTPYKPTPKVVLLCLGDNANDQGQCHPSLKTISQKSSISTSNLNYVLNTFEAIKMISRKRRKRDNGSNTSTLYQINIAKLKDVAFSEGKARQAYLKEFEVKYKQIVDPKGKRKKSKNQSLDKGANQPLDKGKNQQLDKLIQPIGQLYEPSVNHQREDIDISSLSKRADFLKSQLDFINWARAHYKDLSINTVDENTKEKIVICVDADGLLYNKLTGKHFRGTRALKMWANLYRHALNNPEPFLKITKEETTDETS